MGFYPGVALFVYAIGLVSDWSPGWPRTGPGNAPTICDLGFRGLTFLWCYRNRRPSFGQPFQDPRGRLIFLARHFRILLCFLMWDSIDLAKTHDERGLMVIHCCRAVDRCRLVRLAMDLYADECHCLWELIQNADDNKCASARSEYCGFRV